MIVKSIKLYKYRINNLNNGRNPHLFNIIISIFTLLLIFAFLMVDSHVNI